MPSPAVCAPRRAALVGRRRSARHNYARLLMPRVRGVRSIVRAFLIEEQKIVKKVMKKKAE